MQNHRAVLRPRHRQGPRAFLRLPLATAIHLACFSAAFASDAAPGAQADAPPAYSTQTAADGEKTAQLGDITVTAQKRIENAQSVPLSIDVLSADKLTEMNVNGFNDYVKMLPSVSTESYSPGFAQVYMRGISTGSGGGHSGPLPSVGIYLDEEPITTIQGALDMHLYDVARVEALAGPQGTLYGASSQSGTIRIITNKPDPAAFSASVSTEVNSVAHGTLGYVTEGYVNLPLTSRAALRVVAWNEHDGGYTDNVYGTRFYPSAGITANNADQVHDHDNETWLRGARAALKLDLDGDWSITPTVIGQSEHNTGLFGYDPHVGDLKYQHYAPENQEDRWLQSALTVQGKIGNFDLVYAFAHLNRSDHTISDYSDYSFWYDTLVDWGTYIRDSNGNLINPAQYTTTSDRYRKTSSELRLSSSRDARFRFVVGAFTEIQRHDILTNYQIRGIAPELSVPNFPGTVWLSDEVRRDNDYAGFGEISYDVTDTLTATAGVRYYHTTNSLAGFSGLGLLYGEDSAGTSTCFADGSIAPYPVAPCTNLDKSASQDGHVGRANLTYKFDRDRMVYATWSQGFRPGGVNRNREVPPYKADYLTNTEVGWKTEWFDHRLRWNGDVFLESWKNFQFSYIGANGLPETHNANSARVTGLESNLQWAATYNLTLSGGITLLRSKLTANYCGFTDADNNPVSYCPPGTINPQTGEEVDGPLAPKGTRLPLTAKAKGNLAARYAFDAWGSDAYLQVAAFFEGRRSTDLRVADNGLIGDIPGYGSLDLSAGFKQNKWSFDAYVKNVFDSRGELNRLSLCPIEVCVQPPGTSNSNLPGQYYVNPIQPRTIGIRVSRNFE